MNKILITLEVEYDEKSSAHPAQWDWAEALSMWNGEEHPDIPVRVVHSLEVGDLVYLTRRPVTSEGASGRMYRQGTNSINELLKEIGFVFRRWINAQNRKIREED